MRFVQYLRYLVLVICLLCICSLTQAAVVTLDVDSKTAVSDDDTIAAVAFRVYDQQVGVLIQNTTDKAKTVKLVFKGLTADEYDFYLDGVRAGSKPASELLEKTEIKLGGAAFEPKYLHCLNSAKPALEAAYKQIEGNSTEVNRARSNIIKALDKIRSGLRIDERNRAVSVLITPKDRILQKMGFPKKLSLEDAAAGIKLLCLDLQEARDRMFHELTDSRLRHSVVSALTPVSLAAAASAKEGTFSVDVKLTNDTNLPVTSEITLSLPQGWKADPGKLQLKTPPASSSSFSIPLVRQSENAVLPEELPVLADVTITEGEFTASLQLKTQAERK